MIAQLMSDIPPYPGLRPFNQNESHLFFGRDNNIDQLVETLQRNRFLAVLGPSGSGKSSLVRSGLFEALKGGLATIAGSRWTIADISHPGNKPYHELARALLNAAGLEAKEAAVAELGKKIRRAPNQIIKWWAGLERDAFENLLILVDQFEELFTDGGNTERDEIESFVEQLMFTANEPAQRIFVVMTMRSEYLGGCSLIPQLSEAINKGLVLTPRMERKECEIAITGPSYIAEFDIDERLTTALLNDLSSFAPFSEEEAKRSNESGESIERRVLDRIDVIARRADQLPLMQHILNRMWHHADDERSESGDDTPIRLTYEMYKGLGRLKGALSAHADAIMDETEDKEAVKLVFRTITRGSKLATAVRRRQTYGNLVAETGLRESRVRNVFERFRATDCNFLIPDPLVELTNDTRIDITHESLIRNWKRLGGWLEEEYEAGAQWRDMLSAYENQARDGLLTGRRLRYSKTWLAQKAVPEAWTIRYGGKQSEVEQFVNKSQRAEDAREKAEDSKRRRRLLSSLAGAAALFVMGSFAVTAVFNADAAREIAITAEKQAETVKQEAERDRKAANIRIDKAETATVQSQEFAEVARKEAAEEQRKAQLASNQAKVAQNLASIATTKAAQLAEGGAITVAIIQDQIKRQIDGTVNLPPDIARGALDDHERAIDIFKRLNPGVALDLKADLEYAELNFAARQLDADALRIFGEDAGTGMHPFEPAQKLLALGYAERIAGNNDKAIEYFTDSLKKTRAISNDGRDRRYQLENISRLTLAASLFDKNRPDVMVRAQRECALPSTQNRIVDELPVSCPVLAYYQEALSTSSPRYYRDWRSRLQSHFESLETPLEKSALMDFLLSRGRWQKRNGQPRYANDWLDTVSYNRWFSRLRGSSTANRRFPSSNRRYLAEQFREIEFKLQKLTQSAETESIDYGIRYHDHRRDIGSVDTAINSAINRLIGSKEEQGRWSENRFAITHLEKLVSQRTDFTYQIAQSAKQSGIQPLVAYLTNFDSLTSSLVLLESVPADMSVPRLQELDANAVRYHSALPLETDNVFYDELFIADNDTMSAIDRFCSQRARFDTPPPEFCKDGRRGQLVSKSLDNTRGQIKRLIGREVTSDAVLIDSDQNRVALGGLDVVSCHQAKRNQLCRLPVGVPKFGHRYKGYLWLFSSAENLRLFRDGPEKYIPKLAGLNFRRMTRFRQDVIDCGNFRSMSNSIRKKPNDSAKQFFMRYIGSPDVRAITVGSSLYLSSSLKLSSSRRSYPTSSDLKRDRAFITRATENWNNGIRDKFAQCRGEWNTAP